MNLYNTRDGKLFPGRYFKSYKKNFITLYTKSITEPNKHGCNTCHNLLKLGY